MERLRPIRTALVGYGLGGSVFHAPLIRACAGLELVAIATSRAVPPDVASVADPQGLLDDPHIDLVVIASPNETHFPIARAALEAGKHVVVDKPFAATTAEADALIVLARERGLILSVFQNRRWDGDYLTVQALLASGRLGAPRLCEMHWDRFRPTPPPGWKNQPAQGTGLLYDLGSHLVDQALQLFGTPESVSADLAVQRAGGAVDDYFDMNLVYRGFRVRLAAATVVAAPRPRFSFHGTGGSFVKTGLDPQEDQLKAGMRPGDPGFAEGDPCWHGTFTGALGERERIPTLAGRYGAYYEGIAAAIVGKGPAPVDPAEARTGLALIEAALASARQGCVISFAQGR